MLTAVATIVVSLLLTRFVVTPYRSSHNALSVRLETEKALLQHDLDLLRELESYPAQLQSAASELAAVSSSLFVSSSPEATSAALIRYLEAQAADTAVQLTLLRYVPPPEDRSDAQRVAVLINGRADLEGLLTFLRSLETGPKIVRISGLSIARMESAPGEDAAAPEVLSFSLRAEGIRVGPLGTAATRPQVAAHESS